MEERGDNCKVVKMLSRKFKFDEKIVSVVILAIAIKIFSILIRGFIEIYRTYGMYVGVYHQFDEVRIGSTAFNIMVLLSLIIVIAFSMDLSKYYNRIRQLCISITVLTLILIIYSYRSYGGWSKPYGYGQEELFIGYIVLFLTFVSKEWDLKILKRLGIVIAFVSITSFLVHLVIRGPSIVGGLISKSYVGFELSLLYGAILTYSATRKEDRLVKSLLIPQISLALLILYLGRAFL